MTNTGTVGLLVEHQVCLCSRKRCDRSVVV